MLKCVLFFSEKNIRMLTLSCSQQGYVMVVFTDDCFHLSYTHNYLGIYLHLQITAQMTCSRDQHQLPKISQPQSFRSYFFCAICFPVWGFFYFFFNMAMFLLSFDLGEYMFIFTFSFRESLNLFKFRKSNNILLLPKQLLNEEDTLFMYITHPCGLRSPASSVISWTNHI